MGKAKDGKRSRALTRAPTAGGHHPAVRTHLDRERTGQTRGEFCLEASAVSAGHGVRPKGDSAIMDPDARTCDACGTDWDSAACRTARATSALGATRTMRSESYSGGGTLANAQGNVVAGPPVGGLSAGPPDEPPSLLFVTSLVDYVYSLAAQVSSSGMLPLVEPVGLTEVGHASIPLDPVTPTAVVWTADGDPTVGYLAFRGTVGTFEWLLDGYYAQVPYRFAAQPPPAPAPPTTGALVHSGFAGAYDSGLGAAVRNLVTGAGIRRLYIAGHSLGGALAVLAAADLAGLSASAPAAVEMARVWTMGAPRVGNPVFSQAFDALRARVVPSVLQVRSEDDPVPLTPLPVMIDPADTSRSYYFEHVGTVTYFRNPQPTLAGSHSMANYLAFADHIVPAISVPPSST